MSWQETPQQAIEDYLDALLSDSEYVEEGLEEGLEEEQQPLEESMQARQLSASMLQSRQKPAAQTQVVLTDDYTRPVQLDEPIASSQVILPNIKLPEAEPVVETLADVVKKIEAAPPVEEQLEISELETPELEIPELEIPELEIPELEIPELEIPELEIPELEIPELEIPELEVEALVEVEAPVVEPETAAAVAHHEQTIETPAADQPPSPPNWKNGRPLWAQERFECLLFKVKGLTLAVPLVELGGIIKIEKQPTPLFGQPDWYIGMLRSNNMNVSMVDTAQWVLPAAFIEKNTEPYQLVVRIHDSAWGLACNEVDRSISLEPEQVRWRTSLGKRPWLAGTVIEHMCALIDAAAFGRLLKEGHGDLEPANLTDHAPFTT